LTYLCLHTIPNFMVLLLQLLVCLNTGYTNHVIPKSEKGQTNAVQLLYNEFNLKGVVDFKLFQQAVSGFYKYTCKKQILAIADYSRPSDEKRFFVLDLKNKKLLLSTWVAHGKNSGLRTTETFSNKPESYQSCPGFFKIGKPIVSPKHGDALLLYGLQKGINDNALKREIIIHAADYVGEDFIAKYGRCGRSHGCPALPKEVIDEILPVLTEGSLLYIHPGK